MEGRIVEFIEDGKLFYGLCLQAKVGKLHILTCRNKEINLSEKRVLLASQKRYPTDKSREELVGILKELEGRSERLKTHVSVKELWETVKDEEALQSRDLAELVFGFGIGDEHISATLRALFEDRLYFRLKENLFYPVSEEKIEEYFHRLKREEERQERIRAIRDWIKEAMAGRPKQGEVWDDAVALLKDLALRDREAGEYELLKEVFLELGGPDPRKARELLVKIGVWRDDEDLDLLKSSLSLEFPPDIEQEVFRLRRFRVTPTDRKDLRDIKVFTIDGPKTRDFDDALSLEIRPHGFRLGIHISDTTPYIGINSRLEQVLMERVSSIYLPTRYIPMMPPALSEDGLSLLEGLDRYAISLMVELDRDLKVTGFEFFPSVIRVWRQMTYDQVDQAMDSEEEFEVLNSLSEILKKQRTERGALDLTLPEVVVVYRSDGRLDLFQLDLSSPSRRIVQETMILYNALAAELMAQRSAPALFRVQEGPVERIPNPDQDRIYYVFQQRRRLLPLTVRTIPGPHVPLGVGAYVQVTSPIRRLLDLLVQRQLKALITGEPLPYDDRALEEIRAQTEPILKEQDRVRRASIAHWTLRYLEQNREKVFHGLVLDDLRNRFRIVIKEALFIVEAKKEGFRKGVAPGDEILIKITKVDPWTGQAEVREAF